MKAVILAGGKGTRGKPYTEYFPKAMTPINGKPMIDYIVKYLKSFSFVNEIIIISDFNGLGGQIKNYYWKTKKHHVCSRLTKWDRGRSITHCRETQK